MTPKRTHFGATVSGVLKSRGMRQEDLAEAVGRSQSYTNQVLNGQRSPSAQWADLVANALALSPEDRANLHPAAAKDNGFKIELPDFDG